MKCWRGFLSSMGVRRRQQQICLPLPLLLRLPLQLRRSAALCVVGQASGPGTLRLFPTGPGTLHRRRQGEAVDKAAPSRRQGEATR